MIIVTLPFAVSWQTDSFKTASGGSMLSALPMLAGRCRDQRDCLESDWKQWLANHGPIRIAEKCGFRRIHQMQCFNESHPLKYPYLGMLIIYTRKILPAVIPSKCNRMPKTL
jgi:hypothetical protein